MCDQIETREANDGLIAIFLTRLFKGYRQDFVLHILSQYFQYKIRQKMNNTLVLYLIKLYALKECILCKTYSGLLHIHIAP